MNKRTHVILAEQLVKDIDALVGRRQRSSFLTQAAERGLVRLRQLKALDELKPWKDRDHPELRQGAAKWVRKLRRSNIPATWRYSSSTPITFPDARLAGELERDFAKRVRPSASRTLSLRPWRLKTSCL